MKRISLKNPVNGYKKTVNAYSVSNKPNQYFGTGEENAKGASMANSKDSYRDLRIDVLKSVSIIAVVLFHFLQGRYIRFGYLGVDVFLVLAGYLTTRSIWKGLQNNSFTWKLFILKRLVRTYPLVLSLGFFAFVLGYFIMLPDAFENLNESIVASNFFANNILAVVTTKNYWDIGGLYKPLMHTWYLGVLMQAYFVLSLTYLCVYKSRRTQRSLLYSAIILTILSYALYLAPFQSYYKFYLLPFRLFELSLGGIVAMICVNRTTSGLSHFWQKVLSAVVSIILFLLLFSDYEIIPTRYRLSIVVVCSSVLLYLITTTKSNINNNVVFYFSLIGKGSLSIYIWHQFIIAFINYSITDSIDLLNITLCLFLIVLTSVVSYRLVETRLDKILRQNSLDKVRNFTFTLFAVVLLQSTVSLYYYQKAGIVRDIPELDITTTNTERGIHGKYCDRVYSWDQDFSNDSRIKALVIGNSYGRDWANVLSESAYSDNVEISYSFFSVDGRKDLTSISKRINKADIVFFVIANFTGKPSEIPQSILTSCPKEKLWVVGNKYFGKSNGIVYNQRFSKDFLQYAVDVDEDFLIDNQNQKNIYKDHYIDLFLPVLTENRKIKVFTPDGKYISQDCRHLTQNGAKFYAQKIDLSWMLNVR